MRQRLAALIAGRKFHVVPIYPTGAMRAAGIAVVRARSCNSFIQDAIFVAMARAAKITGGASK